MFLKKGLFLTSMLLLYGNSSADERIMRNQDSVTERRHSDLEALGHSIGGFTLFPKFGYNSEYNDNIFDTEIKQKRDYIAHIQPGFKLKSDWARHMLKLDVNSDLGFYSDNPDQNYEDVNLHLSSRVDVLRDSTLNLGFSFYKSHEERNSPDQQGGAAPTAYITNGWNLSYKHKFNRFFTKVGINAQHVQYDNTPAFIGGTINNQDRNHWHYQPSIRLGYEIQPQYDAYIDFRFTGIDYDERFDDNGFERESTGYEAIIGFAFDATGLLSGDIAIGYQYKDVVDNRLSRIAGLTGLLNLEWNVTPLMTIHSSIYRAIWETTQAGSSGVFVTNMNIGVEHELLRQLLLSADFDYNVQQYNGFDRTVHNEDRDEGSYSIRVGGKYIFSRFLSLDLSYQFRKRNVNRDLGDYQTNQVFLNLVGRI